MNDGAAAQGEDTNDSLSVSENWKTKCNFVRVRGGAFNKKKRGARNQKREARFEGFTGGKRRFSPCAPHAAALLMPRSYIFDAASLKPSSPLPPFFFFLFRAFTNGQIRCRRRPKL